MSDSTLRLDPVDATIAVAVGAAGAAAVKFLDIDPQRWWLPGAIGALVGLGAALLAPRPHTPASLVPAPLPPPPTARAITALEPDESATVRVARSPRTRTPLPEDDDATVVRRRTAPAVFETDRFSVRSLSLPKLGNEHNENEDGIFVATDLSRLAVADGASSAFASRQWAQILTESFATQPAVDLSIADARGEFVERCARRWQAAVAGGSDWWSNDARDRGSFAAFVGVTIGDDLKVVANAVGDCCLFVLDRSQQLRLAFPLDNAAAFDSTPSLLSTNEPDEGEWRRAKGRLTTGDTLVLASDAVAQWLLSDAARLPWLSSSDPDAWAQELNATREQHVMVNDDVTVVTVTCKGA